MPKTYRFLLHTDGPALWPEHKPLAEVQELKDTTVSTVWEATYQGNPVPPEGTIFQRKWFTKRYNAADTTLVNECIARWVSFDTASKDEETNAYTACAVGELLPDYRMLLRLMWRERMQFPYLPDAISNMARRFNYDGKLRGVLIEDKSTGTSAYQSLMASAEDWLKVLLRAFQPQGDKEQRANQAALWCKNNCVWLPAPSADVPWLIDFEDELFSFPNSTFKDQVDAFSQLIIYTEHFLAEGFHARRGA